MVCNFREINRAFAVSYFSVQTLAMNENVFSGSWCMHTGVWIKVFCVCMQIEWFFIGRRGCHWWHMWQVHQVLTRHSPLFLLFLLFTIFTYQFFTCFNHNCLLFPIKIPRLHMVRGEKDMVYWNLCNLHIINCTLFTIGIPSKRRSITIKPKLYFYLQIYIPEQKQHISL